MSFFGKKPPSESLSRRFGLPQDEMARALATGDTAAMARILLQRQKAPAAQPAR